MTLLHALAILAVGALAGAINTVVGAGMLFTFPLLLAFGYAPVVANVTATVGVWPGALTGAAGYRRELVEQRGALARLLVASVSGAALGGALLLSLPGRTFRVVAPAFIILALALIVLAPRLARAQAARRAGARPRERVGPLALAAVLAIGVYGGYFGAAQGIVLLAVLGLSLDGGLQRINALKVVLAGATNFVAAVIFMLAGPVAWLPALLIAGGSLAGGVLGAKAARMLPAAALRALIVAIGIFAVVRLLT